MLAKNRLCLPSLVFFYSRVFVVPVAVEEAVLLDVDS